MRVSKFCAPLAFVLVAGSASAQTANEAALERARAVDACDGRPVLTAEMVEGNRVNVTCGEAGAPIAEGVDTGGGLGSGAGIGAAIAVLLLLGLAAGGGGGGSAGGTN
jgi:hypothetical protein